MSGLLVSVRAVDRTDPCATIRFLLRNADIRRKKRIGADFFREHDGAAHPVQGAI
jgi:hypothetical protein